ncbi:MAG TPA: MFS transporter [Pseudonocardiaceae bacterium]|nr:MFS transporter [Pseudonocardiaceae bacterium]
MTTQTRTAAPPTAAFAAVVAIMVLFQAAASAPTPLYVVYQRMWGFSSATLTLVFAIFVLVLLATLLVAGALSDHVGRRPVLLAGITLEAVALLLFLFAGGVSTLLAARAVQGVATGLILPTLGATVVDLNPPHRPRAATVVNGVVPVGGLAVGSIACGALVQYGPDPTRLVWLLLLGTLVLAFVAVLALPESSARRPGVARSLVPRLGVPQRLRGDVVALVPVIVASWALGGLYLSLGPSAAAAVFGVTNHFLGGLVATLLCGTGAVAAFVFAVRRTAAGRASVTLLAVGTALTLVGVLTGEVATAIAGTVVAGVGYGASGLATFGRMAGLPAQPAERGELFAVGYTVAYLAFSLPALAAGFASTRIGLHTTVVAYAAVVIVVAVAAGRRRWWSGRSAA